MDSAPPNIPLIAGKLTKAQRAAIVDQTAYPLPSMGPAGYDSVILGFQHGRSAKSLHALGLATLPFAPQILTRTGMHVRAHLEQENRG